jgi:hypothetical protein
MEGRAGWNGSVLECSQALRVLLAPGKPTYRPQPSDPCDDVWMVEHMNGIHNMFSIIPRGNGKYSTFVKGVLKVMSDKDMEYANVPTTLNLQLREAETAAAVLRTVCFHVRREWYRRSTKQWVKDLPRPRDAGGAGEAAAPPPPALAPAAAAAAAAAAVQPLPPAIRSHSAALLHACHGEGPDLYSTMLNEVDDEDDDGDTGEVQHCENDEFEDELVYTYGFANNSAWRSLVDAGGETIMDKEYATHCSDPPNGVGLMTAHFLDGTEHIIAGMVCLKKRPPEQAGNILKRPAKAPVGNVLKRPAKAAAKAESSSDHKQDAEEEAAEDVVHDAAMSPCAEEEAEEEASQDFSDDPEEEPEEEVVEPNVLPEVEKEKDPLIGKYVITGNLNATHLNGIVCKVLDRRVDGRLIVFPSIAGDKSPFWVTEDKLIVTNSARGLVPHLRENFALGEDSFQICACTQGDRACIVIVKHGAIQFGQVSSAMTDGSIVEAFLLARAVMASLKETHATSGVFPTKADFYRVRDQVPERPG